MKFSRLKKNKEHKFDFAKKKEEKDGTRKRFYLIVIRTADFKKILTEKKHETIQIRIKITKKV